MMWNYLVSGPADRRHDRAVRRRPRLARPRSAVAARRPTTASPASDVGAPFAHGVPQGRADARRATSTCRRCAASARPARRCPPKASGGSATPSARDVQTDSISGGTDMCTAFVGRCPDSARCAPVRSPCRCSAATSRPSHDAAGRAVAGEHRRAGASTAPMPSMPVGSGATTTARGCARPTSSDLPGRVAPRRLDRVTDRGACVITGRCDATLNRGGVRLGTADFYAVVEAPPEVADSLVVHLEDADGGRRAVAASSRSPPARIWTTSSATGCAGLCAPSCRPATCPTASTRSPAVPRTLSGKKLEVPVKRVLLGADAGHRVVARLARRSGRARLVRRPARPCWRRRRVTGSAGSPHSSRPRARSAVRNADLAAGAPQ